MATGSHAFMIGDVLDKLERATREIGKSLDSMRGRVDYGRLGQAREKLGDVIEALDALLAERP
ncbi:MAG: hypothetical protein IH608_13460 [Proteobacteria bacterium]|nr:hypothetical protein [Pseudomonadota bacterium]